ncbi:hypothetical protein NQ314_021422 [Rhamnusium bicolor]|uniref:DDE Tnp4 domain-containing protein n=1 Tax=Rhamnusium bicolor TaxID=1586634 RepID=A0AAV8WI61_9CUCU|nr:hypothetical protein NQ314_021422 [Rhamnusium bicolor]
MFDSDLESSDDELLELIAKERVRPKNKNYCETIVPQYNDLEFIEHFRISRDVVERVSEEFENSEYFKHHSGRNGVIGAIDMSHIKIDKPSNDPDSYLNRKHFFSIQLQVVCDHRRKIRDVFVGYPGSVHDSRVFRTSPLYETLGEKCGNNYLLGDSGYPCMRHLLTPYRDSGNLNRRQNNFNLKLSKNRYVIEHCFGIMKQKFRQLYHIKLRSIPDIVHFIRACCVLHNMGIRR